MSAPLQVAVIGAGRMGTHHARVLGAVPGATLAGVLDKHPERAAVLGERHGCRVFADLDEIARSCDAAIFSITT